MQKLLLLTLVFSFSFLQVMVFSLNQNPDYHMGPVLTSPINLYIIWYGQQWNPTHQSTIRDFITSLSSRSPKHPSSVSDWWRTITLYNDQTNWNVTSTINLSNEFYDREYSQSKHLTRLSMQAVIKNAVLLSNPDALPLDYTNGAYLILTSREVTVQDFCQVCGFHYFTFTSIVGAMVPYAWVGYSGKQCPGVCDLPFQKPPNNPTMEILRPPNGDPATDGMISVIAHELAEMSTNPFVNAWYQGDQLAPYEIADMCQGVYGEGAGGGYIGAVYKDKKGNGYNLNGVNNRKFLVQWVWNPVTKSCYGPNHK